MLSNKKKIIYHRGNNKINYFNRLMLILHQNIYFILLFIYFFFKINWLK